MELLATVAKWVLLAMLITAVAATVGGFIKGQEIAKLGIYRMTTPNELPMRRGVEITGWVFGLFKDTPVGSNTETNVLDALRLFVAALVSAGALMLTWKTYQYFMRS